MSMAPALWTAAAVTLGFWFGRRYTEAAYKPLVHYWKTLAITAIAERELSDLQNIGYRFQLSERHSDWLRKQPLEN